MATPRLLDRLPFIGLHDNFSVCLIICFYSFARQDARWIYRLHDYFIHMPVCCWFFFVYFFALIVIKVSPSSPSNILLPDHQPIPFSKVNAKKSAHSNSVLTFPNNIYRQASMLLLKQCKEVWKVFKQYKQCQQRQQCQQCKQCQLSTV